MAGTGEIVVDIKNDELLSSIHHKFQVIGAELVAIASPTIYRVLPRVRKIGSGDYDPQIISIGPFHQMKEALHPMEQLKWRFLHDLIGRHPSNSLAKYVDKVRSLAARARKSYSEFPRLPDDAFVEMMMLDCCFIIEFLVKLFIGDDPNGPLYAVSWNLPLLRNDLLLVENQVPYFVLQSLFDSSVIPELDDIVEDGDFPITLTELAINYVTSGEFDAAPNSNDIHHLLHLFHSNLRSTIRPPYSSNAYQDTHSAKRAIKNIKHLVSFSLYWLLSLFLYCRMPPPGEKPSRVPRLIPSATELQDAGVEFKKKKARSFIDITFRNGTMEMPLLSIEENTISLFRNLVVFEQCCPTAGNHFTAYTALMDNLIDTPEDVALLVSCGILNSKLSGNEEVAEFFNSLGKGAYLDYARHYLVELFRDVDNFRAAEIHRLRAIHRWRAMLRHDYFSKPWATISLIAAFVLLILTMVQTYFAVLAYYHPPS